MGLIDAGLRGALVAVLVLVVLMLLPHWRHARHADLVRTGIALSLSSAVQALSASPWVEHELRCAVQAPGIGISLGSAVLFWLFARAVFEDGFRLRPWHGLLWGAVALFGAMACQWGTWWQPWVLMRAIPVVFALLGLAAVAGPWRVDLVEPRRRLRGLVVGGGASYALAMVALRVSSRDGTLSDATALADVAMLLTLTSLIAWQLLRPSAFRARCERDLAEDFPACVGLATRLTGGALDGFKLWLARRVLGWKFGGDDAPQTHTDPRMAAIVAAVPAAADFDMSTLAKPRVPLGLITADGDRWLAPRFHGDAVLAACQSCELLAALPGAGHGALLAPPPPASNLGRLECDLLCDPPGFDRPSATARWVEAVVHFFRERLR
ncbi:hypothetical protein J2X20_001194 [Pelomonas saccharophila]|uniref:Peptidase S33 tripeptidyl aminopeptidase-like C-terminal domain-containing protein n=1 Tax=Roseateles saccharophilus TaxID=304 RepID=A0ABU1YK39_ROSSA|nr:hypothetical protein [Roseateles saccharophilus]MDR7268565.1 hypothetical protein [Roseateles saccharophilus]